MSYNITSTNTGVVLSNSTTQNPSTVVSGAYVTNTNTSGYAPAIDGYAGTAWDLYNYGTIVGNPADSSIFLASGGRITNGASALIAGAGGINIDRSTGTVANYGTISGRTGVILHAGGSVTNGASGSSAALISGSYGGVGIGQNSLASAGTVANFGTISGATNNGVFLYVGGSVTNGASGASAALISGDNDGVYIRTSAVGSTVTNYGTISGTGTAGIGVALGQSGSVTNNAGGLIEGRRQGVSIAGTAGTVGNAGTIIGTSSYGVVMAGSGSVDNTGLMEGGSSGVEISSVGTVSNAGTILGTSGEGIRLGPGGNVASNAGGLIEGGNRGVYILGAAGTVSNAGTILGMAGASVVLAAGGTVVDSGIITGSVGGVLINGGAGTVSNYGTIASTGSGSTAINLQAGGYGTNYASNAYGGLISAPTAGDAVVIAGTLGTVINAGTIAGGNLGVWLKAGGSVVNSGSISATDANTGDGVTFGNAGSGAGTLLNTGQISAPNLAVWLEAGGYVGNGAGGTISGGSDGVLVSTSAGTVNNFGTIDSTGGNGVYLDGGGLVINHAGRAGGLGPPVPPGLISGYDGVRIAGAAGTGTLLNDGNIVSTGTGFGAQAVDFLAGGTLYNYGAILGTNTNASGVNAGVNNDTIINGATNNGSATIAGYLNGIDQFSGIGTVINFGTVKSSNGDAIYLQQGGTVDNRGGAGGLISGSNNGVRVGGGAGTVINAGTIEGAVDAVIFTGAGNRLIVDPGAVFFGSVNGGGGGNDVLELAAGTTGTLGGSQYTGFDVTQIDAGASWAVAGNYTIPAGGTLLDFGTLTNLGTLLGSGAQLIVDPGTFVNSGYVNTTVTLDGGSYLDNTSTGTISVAGTAVLGLNSPNTVVNAGTILGSGTSGLGIDLRAGGSVSNAGVISAGGGGVDVSGSAGTLDNAGTIVATAGSSVYFAAGGTVTNSGTIENSGTHDAVLFNNAAGSVVNSGTIAAGTGAPAPAAPAAAPANGDTVFDTTPSWDGSSFINAFGSPDTATYGQTFVAPADNVLQSFTFYLEGSATLQFQAEVYAWSGNLLGGNGPQGATGSALFTSTPITLGPTGGVFQPVTVNTGGVRLTAGGHYIVLLTVSGPDPTDFTNSGSGELWGDTQRTHVANDGGGGFNFDNNGSNFAALTGSSWDDFSDFGDLAWTATFTPGTPAGVDLAAGGSVTNVAGGLIEGGIGVSIGAAVGTVDNSGTIEGTGGAGVAFRNGGVASNTGGLITGTVDGIAAGGSTVTLSNSGTIAATETLTGASTKFSFGVIIGTGSVDNTGLITAAAQYNDVGLQLNQGGTVTNTGTITAFGTNGGALHFISAGGSINNSGLIAGYNNGIGFFPPGSIANAGTLFITNHGTIESTQKYINVVNGNTLGGEAINAGANTTLVVDNFATIKDFQIQSTTITNSGTVGIGAAVVLSTGTVVNEAGAVIDGMQGHSIAVRSTDGAGVTITNSGTLASEDPNHSNVYIGRGGATITNSGAVALITAAYRNAISFGTAGGTGIVVNSGTIRSLGTNASGIYLGQGGTVANQTGGLIYGATGVSIRGTPGTITNFGTIQSTAAGTVGEAVFLGAGGRIVNYGLISGARPPVMVGTSTSFGSVVVTATAGATVDNFGTISGDTNSNNGIALLHGGLVFNRSNALILGSQTGVYGGGHLANNGTRYSYAGALTTVVNYGTIANTTSIASDVRIVADGTVINHGLIDSPRTSISFGFAAGTVDNFGTVRSTAATSFTAGAGIYLQSGGLITNEASGVVTAQRAAISLGTSSAAATITNRGILSGNTGVSINAADTGAGTIANFGTIVGTGGTAISLGGGADLVILEPGSTLSGAIAGFVPGDTLDLVAVPFSPSDTVTFDGTILTVSGGGVSESVALAGIAAGTDFILESDAQGDAQIGPVSSGSNLVVSSGQILTVLAGQNVSNVTVESGGVLDVASGGVASGATIEAGGVETVFTGGTDSGATVSSGGFEDVFGSATATLVLNGGSQTVEAGGSVTGAVLDGAGLQTVAGFAGGTVVGSGDEELVTSGGVASGSVISSGGSEIVLSGGLASDTTIAGGTLELEAGAMASGLISFAGSGGVLQLDSLTMPEAAVAGLLTGDVIDFRALPFAGGDTVAFDGTILTVSGGGVSESVRMTGLGASSVFLLRSDGNGGTDAGLVPASGAVVSAGEVLHISAGETLSDVTVLSGGILEVDAGGTALGTMVSSGGEELVLSGGTDSGAVISGGGFEDVFGNASATLVLNGGSQTVEAGGSVTGAVLDGVGLQTVSGVAIGTVVSGGDEQLVLSGGVAIGTTVLSGGLLVVASGGVASGAVIANGGEAVVSAGGVDRGAMTSGGGVEEVFGSAGGTVVLSGGEQLVEPGGSASGTVISQGGLEQVLGGVTSDTRIAGGKLEVTTGAAAAGVIGFGGVVGTLRLDSLATPAATLGGVVAGDVIDLPLLSFATSDTATLGQNDLLTVSGGGESVSLQFDASVAGKGFALSDDGSGGVLLTLTPQVPQASLFDFVFVYNGGQDYYLGRVADDGRFGYTVGETKTNAAGSYIIFGEESGATSAAAGSVFVDYYSHGGPGAASGIPVKTAAGNADGNAGLGSESDTLLGLDGAGHAFSSTQPAVFATTALYGFVFTYANGAAYTGTVADNTPGGLPGSRTVRDGSGNLLGVYTTFREGVTSRAAGSVVIDRFVANGIAVLANHASSTAVDGRSGLGSEVGSVTVGSVNHAFGPRAEPVVTGNAPTEPAASTPPVSDVIANEVDRIFVDILGRFPSQSEFDATGGELGQGTSTGDVRAALASGSEASGDVTGLYGQVFGRAATTGEISGASGMLADGGSLASLQQQLANSSEAAGDINQVYRDILGHDADPSGLASFVAALGDETPGHLTDPGGLAGLAGVRDVLAHSGQAQDALTSLFDGIIGRAPSNAELVGMEDRLVTAGTTEATLRNALSATGSAGGFTTIAAPGGTASLSAPSGPSLFQFSDVAFNDTITGFNAGRDTIQLPKTVAADFATVEADTTGASGGSLITLNQNQSIFLASLPPAKLAAGNFLLL